MKFSSSCIRLKWNVFMMYYTELYVCIVWKCIFFVRVLFSICTLGYNKSGRKCFHNGWEECVRYKYSISHSSEVSGHDVFQVFSCVFGATLEQLSTWVFRSWNLPKKKMYQKVLKRGNKWQRWEGDRKERFMKWEGTWQVVCTTNLIITSIRRGS